MDIEEIQDINDDEMEEDEASDSSTSSDGEEVDDDEDVKNATDIKNEENENPTAFLPGQQKLEEGEELVMDEQAYIVYHQASLGTPCLSFDIIPDDLGNDRADAFPLTMYGVAGTQAPKSSANSIVVFKMENLHPIKRKVAKNSDENESDESDDSDDEETSDDPEKEPRLKVAALKHHGCVNRIRFKNIGGTALAAAWSEKGSVGIWSLDHCFEKVNRQGVQSEKDQRELTSPLFSFKGHQTEGFAINWCPTMPGVLATGTFLYSSYPRYISTTTFYVAGDCSRNIHIWKPSSDSASWSINDTPYQGHTASVEDIVWSPNEANVLASCSVDKSIRIWDARANPNKANMLTVSNAHTSDINVIDWNANEPFIASGGDDNLLKIWDLRNFQEGQPVAVFKHHTAPITSVEWHPNDYSVLATSGDDHQIALWDLAIEKDSEIDDDGRSNETNSELKDVPPQLLFIHQGMQDVKELHWHRQIPGLLIATSQTGLDVFRTISV